MTISHRSFLAVTLAGAVGSAAPLAVEAAPPAARGAAAEDRPRVRPAARAEVAQDPGAARREIDGVVRGAGPRPAPLRRQRHQVLGAGRVPAPGGGRDGDARGA